MPGTELRLLRDESDPLIAGERFFYPRAAVPDDHDHLGGQSKRAGHGAGRFEHVRQQRPARKRMQHLGQIRSHAFALAGRQDHQIHTVNLSFEKHHLAMARKRL